VEGVGHQTAGAPPGRLSVEGALLRAALLAGYGRRAPGLARCLAAATEFGASRSCLEAGVPVQLTLDAPGRRGLRAGVRVGDDVGALGELIAEAPRLHLTRALARLPAAVHASLGTWLFWTDLRQSIFVDLRDPNPADALARLSAVLDRDQRQRLDAWHQQLTGMRPWALRLEADDDGLRRVHVHWLLQRHRDPATAAEAIAPGYWPSVVETLGHLLRRPGVSGRWTMVTPLDGHSEPGLRVGNSGWTLVPEDDRKHRAVARLMQHMGGDRDHAEALWSMCRGSAGDRWRVGRACEVRCTAGEVRARLFLTPRIQEEETAGTSNSEVSSSTTGVSEARPSSP